MSKKIFVNILFVNFIKKEFILIFLFIFISNLSLFCQSVSFDCNADSWIRRNSTCSSWVNTNYGSDIMMQCNSWTYSYLSCGSGDNRSLLKLNIEEDILSNMLYDNRTVLKLYFPDINNQETQNYHGSATDNIFIIYLVT